MKLICKHCKKAFEITNSDYRRGRGKFCSRECHSKWKIGRNHPRWVDKTSRERTCIICNKKFTPSITDINGGYGKFCSRKCMGKWFSEHNRGRKNPSFKNATIEIACKHCSKKFSAFKSVYRVFCSYECKSAWQSAHVHGANHPLWKGGIAHSPYPKDFNSELREQIRQRDKYMCRKCHRTQTECGRKLPIHHIDYNKRNNDPKNLIALCPSCHSKTNTQRNYWEKLFQEKNEKLYVYEECVI